VTDPSSLQVGSKRKWGVYEILTQKTYSMISLTVEFNKLNMV
jgi:hypothetical protein